MCCGFSISIPAIVTASSWFSSGLLQKISRFLSDRSYSIYLFHYPLLWALGTTFSKSSSLNLASISQLAAKGAIVLAGCMLLHFVFEANTVRVRQALKRRLGIGRKYS